MKILSSEALIRCKSREFESAVQILEQEIEQNPDIISNYWYLGLLYLLQEDEDSAQASWLYGMSQMEEGKEPEWEKGLTKILEEEAIEQEQQNNYSGASLIRWHLYEFQPTNLHNTLKIIDLQLLTDSFEPSIFEELGLNRIFGPDEVSKDTHGLIISIFPKILQKLSWENLKFAESFVKIISQTEWVETLVKSAVKASYKHNEHNYAIELIQLCLKYYPNELTALENLSRLYQRAKRREEAIDAAKLFLGACQTLPLQVIASLMLLDAYMGACEWTEVLASHDEVRKKILKLLDEHPLDLSLGVIQGLIVKSNLFFYLKDNLQESRELQNKAGKVFFENIQRNTQVSLPLYKNVQPQPKDRIKIGYLGNTFYQHSVGWLCRWLFQNHNREEFDVSLYMSREISHLPFFQTWFAEQVDSYFDVDADLIQVAEKIRDDQIDILIDLDSVTLDYSCLILALKPAPIQISWLGMDATGIPTVDYFIADPYVLPDNAEQQYQEKIIRLPHTYIAVDGFESHVPTLKKDELNIPTDSVVFLSAQTGYKRFPDTIRLQMKIIKEVSNSYFLIKGLGTDQTLKELFISIAESEGVSADRLIFLPMDPNEYIHRGNLQIADVVLDTYPYNGATTTLEALWMEIPLVTRVGEQFTARNSYTFLRNVGVNEGVAYSDDEYVEWGIRFGTDRTLRQQVSLRLRRSKSCSPLWNSRQFTREMERTYRDLYSSYLKQ